MLRDGDDYCDPTIVTAEVTVEVLTVRGPAELQKFHVTAEGYPGGDEIEILDVECCECGFRSDTRRRPGFGEGPALVAAFHRYWANDRGMFAGERDQIVEQLRAAIAGESPEAVYERSRHAAAESVYGGSL